MNTLLSLIPLCPLLGSFLVFVLCRRSEKLQVLAGWLATLCSASAFGIVIVLFQGLGAEGEHFTTSLWRWISVSPVNIDLALRFDRLSAVMSLVVTGVGSLIHLYAIGYMAEDDSRPRFFSYLNLFLFSMLLLVLGDNLVVMFVGWEGVGLCSYLLIGFWYKEMENARAGQKAFVVNRIGDAGFLIGMFVLLSRMGTIQFTQMQTLVSQMPPYIIEIAALLLFVGAIGKSAQIPLYVWLPDAMAGPTPVSALIHAATMVTAGVYMMARMSFLYALAPQTLVVVLVIGTLTAFFAATIALVQNDIKRVLAYSTVSQLGYMFMAMGAGAFSNGIFHVVTHAFFKACLFMAAGSVIMGCHHEQDMRHFGGLRKEMPLTFLAYFIATLAIAGFPFLSGFYSKDAILWTVFSNEGLPAQIAVFGNLSLAKFTWLIGLLTAFLTAFYMTRSLMLTFFGEYRGHHEAHESPWVVTVPLLILASLSAVFSFLWGEDLIHYLGYWTRADMKLGHEAFAHNELYHTLELTSIGVALVGIFLAVCFYGPLKSVPSKFASTFSWLYRALSRKWWIDELYGAIIIRPLSRLSSFLFAAIDRDCIDAFVNGTGMFVEANGEFVRRLQSGKISFYLTFMFLSAVLLIYFYLLLR